MNVDEAIKSLPFSTTEILPYDSVFRCLVRSAGGKRVYLVDLEANDGIGFCGCHDFACRKQPKIDRTAPRERRAAGDSLRCKHIRAVRKLRGLQILDDILKQRARTAGQ